MSPTSKNLSPREEENVLCKVCLEHFDPVQRQPKQLPCGHTYCHRCIDNFLAKERPSRGQKVSCPICARRWNFGRTEEIKTSQHSLDLVKSFKHLLARKNLKSKRCQDVQESDMDAFGVERSRRTVVRTSNPLLHPHSNWGDFNFEDDDRFEAGDGDAKSVLSETVSEKCLKNAQNDSLVEAPKSLQKLWAAKDAGENFVPDVTRKNFDPIKDGDENSTRKREESDSMNDRPFVHSPNRHLSKASFENHSILFPHNLDSRSSNADESDDLDWNYFTQSLDSPNSTLTEALIKLKTNPDFPPAYDDNNKKCSLTAASFNRNGMFSDEHFLSPVLVRSAPFLNLVVMVNQTGNKGNSIHVSTADGSEKSSIVVQEKVDDVCLVNPGNDELMIVIATVDGVSTFRATDGMRSKFIPIGPTRFVASFESGFVACTRNSITFCKDLNCDLVLHSLTSIRYNDFTPPGGIIMNIIDMNTCNDLIGLLLSDRCILVDQHGRVVQTLKLIKGSGDYEERDMQLSFSGSGKKMAVVNKKAQLLELHEVLSIHGSVMPSMLTLELLFPRPNGKIVSGTLAKESELVAIAQEAERYQVYKYNIVCHSDS